MYKRAVHQSTCGKLIYGFAPHAPSLPMTDQYSVQFGEEIKDGKYLACVPLRNITLTRLILLRSFYVKDSNANLVGELTIPPTSLDQVDGMKVKPSGAPHDLLGIITLRETWAE